MKKILASLILAAMAMTTAAHAQPSKARLDSLMDYYSKEYRFNGAAFIAYKGNILLEKGYGYRDIEKGIKNDKNTIFQMGSNTKQFTAEVILQLAKEKKMTLQDKLSKYIADYPGGDKITIENLLTHTSGIFNYTDDTAWQEHATDPISVDSLIALFKNRPKQFEPGAKFEYSNSNYVLLGYIIEKVTGKKYEQVVTERILKPCGMKHSGFDFTHLKDDNKATGYYTIQADKFNPAPIADSTLSYAAGALYSTIEDMYKWHQALQSYKLLPKEWQEKAYVPFKDRYAYGWFADSAYKRRLIGHSGGVPGFYTYEMRIEEDDVCILLLQNCEQPSMDNNSICKEIISCMYKNGYELPKPRTTMTVSTDVLKQYTGDYAITPDFSIAISVKDNQLYAQGTDQDAFPLSASGDTKFFSKDVGAEIEFVKDDKGQYNKLILNQGGHKIPAIRK